MNKKLTKKDHFNSLLKLDEVKSNSALVDFINHELELLSRKSSAEKKPSAEQKANIALQDSILEEMEFDKAYTITDMMKELPSCSELTNQKVSAMVRALVDTNKVIRKEEKRKAYFIKPSTL